MVTRFLALVLAVILVAAGVPAAGAQDQPPMPPLPADLLFTTTTAAGDVDYPRDLILRVHAKTLEVSPFYVDNEANQILPLSWSPQGDLLAIYRFMPSLDDYYTMFPRQLCILDRAGVLQRCLDDSPPMHWGGNPQTGLDVFYPVAWGFDGQTIYFTTEYVNAGNQVGYGRRLVEASVTTGKTLRIIYEYPDPYPIRPSPDLNYVAVGFGGNWSGPDAPAFLVNLTTGEQVDVPSLVPNLTELSSTCTSFSPSGHYITVFAEYKLATYAPGQDSTLHDGIGWLMVILDTQGSIQGIIGQPDGAKTLRYQDCPGWQPDEQAIYFYAHDSAHIYLMRYSLTDRQLSTLYKLKDSPEQESTMFPPLIPSSDGAYLAFTVTDDAYASGYDPRQIVVLYPDGEVRHIPSPYHSNIYPLWVPPLDAGR
jgi:hypothetical protein